MNEPTEKNILLNFMRNNTFIKVFSIALAFFIVELDNFHFKIIFFIFCHSFLKDS